MQSTYKKTATLGPIYTETAAEYVLPDYQGDIQKVLLTEASVLPAGKFISTSEIQLAGTVAYEILYTDAEGVLTCAQFSSDYELSLPVREEVSEAMAEVSISGLSVRLCGPRRIAVKGHVCAHVSALTEALIETQGDALAEEVSAQVKEAGVPVRYTVCAEDIERAYTDAVPVGGEADSVQIISQGASCTVSDVRAEDGAVLFTVEACLHALVSSESGVQCLRRSITTEERVDVEGMRDFMKPTVRTASCTAHAMTEEFDGAMAVRLSVQVSFCARAEDNAPVTLLTDGYLCSEETDNVYTPFSYEEYLDTLTVTVDARGQMAADEVCEGTPLRELLHCTATLKSLRATVNDEGRVALEGELQAQSIGVREAAEGTCGLCPIKLTVPFQKEVEGSMRYPAEAVLEVEGEVGRAEATLDADGVHVSVLCLAHVRVLAPHTCRRLSSMQRSGRTVGPLGSVITVYYPREGDTLWDIARTYHTTVSSLCADNGLDATACAADGTVTLPERILIL